MTLEAEAGWTEIPRGKGTTPSAEIWRDPTLGGQYEMSLCSLGGSIKKLTSFARKREATVAGDASCAGEDSSVKREESGSSETGNNSAVARISGCEIEGESISLVGKPESTVVGKSDSTAEGNESD